jgi:hypothetical protein
VIGMKNTLQTGKVHDGKRRQAPGAIRASHASSLRKARRCSMPETLPGAAANKAKPASEEQGRLDRELFAAVEKGNLASVDGMIEKGADVNARDAGGFTALMQAAFLGHKLIARLLVAHGADVEAADRSGRTAVTFASISHNRAIRNMLRQHGAGL